MLLVRNLCGGALHNSRPSGLVISLFLRRLSPELLRMLPLPLDPLPHLLHLLLLEWRHLLLPSWISFSRCMLTLVVISTFSLMRCVGLTPELVVLLVDSYVLVALLLHPSMIRTRSLQLVEMMMVIMFLARSIRMRWLSLNDSPFVTRDKKGK